MYCWRYVIVEDEMKGLAHKRSIEALFHYMRRRIKLGKQLVVECARLSEELFASALVGAR